MSIWDKNWKKFRNDSFSTSELWRKLEDKLSWRFDYIRTSISEQITLPLFGLELNVFLHKLDSELEKLEFIKLVEKWIIVSCGCFYNSNPRYGRQARGTFCLHGVCMKQLVSNLGFWNNKVKYYLSDNALEVQCFPEKEFQNGWVQIIPRKEKFLLDQVKSKQNLKEKTMTSDIYFSFTHAKDINKMVEAVFSLWKNFCEPKKTVIGSYKTKNFDFANLNRRINAFVRHHSPGETKDHVLGKEWDRMSTIKKKQEIKELFYRCLLALVLIE